MDTEAVLFSAKVANGATKFDFSGVFLLRDWRRPKSIDQR
jgi:hypothetical protein